MIESHAPGKLVICGEYAVLAGAAAIAVAMPARARVRVAAAHGAGRLTIAGGATWAFDWQRGLPAWSVQPAEGQGGILDAVAATLLESGLELAAPLDIALDTRAFHHHFADGRTVKLGLGSSAALTVALLAALLVQSQRWPAQAAQLEQLAWRAHRRFQGGAGSGIDVAAAVHGGVVLLEGIGRASRRLSWPGGLHWLAVWSGESASTPQLLARFEAFRANDAQRFARQMHLLGESAATVVAAWERADVPTLLRGLADYDDGLRALDAGAGVGIYTPVHERLARLAEDAGAVYKVSGAGGGDFGIVLADSAQLIAGIDAAFRRDRLLTLRGVAGVDGVVVESGPATRR